MLVMKFGKSIFENSNGEICIIDQTQLPFKFEIKKLESFEDFLYAINFMQVRGAPLIGVTAAYAVYAAAKGLKGQINFHAELEKLVQKLINSRPTAVNLKWAVDRQMELIKVEMKADMIIPLLLANARKLAFEDCEQNKQIGNNGISLIEKIYRKKNDTVNILTHCNAGSLATVEFGTATAPIYEAHSRGIPVHVWVDETRPNNQGTRFTTYELHQNGVPYTLIADNTGGLLMQKGMVDLVVVGADRVAANGDTANKVGTYLKALSAMEHKIPFYVAMPTSTIDLSSRNGDEIQIEERNPEEFSTVSGKLGSDLVTIRLCSEETPVCNYVFDISPAKFISGFITEKGIISTEEIQRINKQ